MKMCAKGFLAFFLVVGPSACGGGPLGDPGGHYVNVTYALAQDVIPGTFGFLGADCIRFSDSLFADPNPPIYEVDLGTGGSGVSFPWKRNCNIDQVDGWEGNVIFGILLTERSYEGVDTEPAACVRRSEITTDPPEVTLILGSKTASECVAMLEQ